MWRCVSVVLAACSFEHGAATDQQPPADTAVIRDAPGDAVGDAKVFLDGKVFLDAPVTPPIAYVQGAGSLPSASSMTVAATFTSPQLAHDLNIVVINWNGAAASVVAVTDTSLNTYTRIDSAVAQGTDVLDVFYAKDIAAASPNVVTAAFDAVVGTPEIRILEYSGIATTSPFDTSIPGQASNSKAVTTGTITTAQASELVVGCEASTDSVKTLGSGYTLRVTDGGDDVADKIVSATGTFDFTATLNNNATWEARVMAFKGL